MRRIGLFLLALMLPAAGTAAAQERHALLVFGAPGGEKYVEQYTRLEASFVTALTETLGFDPDHVLVLTGTTEDPSRVSTRENVRRAFETLRGRVKKDDVLVLVLVGHGSVDAASAKFNLVGPDMDAGEWSEGLRQQPGRLVVLNTTGGSFPFLEALAARDRIVITATESSAQRYDTVFPEMLARALTDQAADLDKNGRVSVFELFTFTSQAVKRHYEREGLLATERAVLDDTGDGVGLEAEGTGPDGALARATYLEREPLLTADPALADLITRRSDLERRAEALKLRKPSMSAAEWDAQWEKLMIELARVSRRIRSGS